MIVVELAIMAAGLWVYFRVPEPTNGRAWAITREGEWLSGEDQ